MAEKKHAYKGDHGSNIVPIRVSLETGDRLAELAEVYGFKKERHIAISELIEFLAKVAVDDPQFRQKRLMQLHSELIQKEKELSEVRDKLSIFDTSKQEGKREPIEVQMGMATEA